MSISEASILKELQLKTVEDGTRIYVYRMRKSGLVIEECLANVHPSVCDPDYFTVDNLRAGRFDENGKLSGVLTIARYSGDVYSHGGHDSVWFVKANKRKAKKALRAFYKERLNDCGDRIARINEKLDLLK